MRMVARSLVATLVALLGAAGPATPPARAAAPAAGRVVYLGRGLSDEALIALASAVHAADPAALLLLDSPTTGPHLRGFLRAYRPSKVIPVGSFSEAPEALARRLGVPVGAPLKCRAGPAVLPEALWDLLFPRANKLVVCPARPRGQLLLAACLAGVEGAPLWVTPGHHADGPLLRERLRRCGAREVSLVGGARGLAGEVHGVKQTSLGDAGAVAGAYHRRLAAAGRVEVAVVCNPADTAPGLGGMSALAPWVALQRRAALLLTGREGRDVAAVVRRAAGRPRLRHLDALILVASLAAVPTEERPNPIPTDKDPRIEMEPLTPRDGRPFSFAVGRLFHSDPAVLPLILGRQRLLAREERPRRALVASNPGGSLPLLETFSRRTAQELRNAGYQTTGLFGGAVTGPRLRKLLPGYDLFLWEGHHNTLIKDWGFASWDEPLPGTFVFLQSCLALKDHKVHPLLERGAVGVVGSSTRTYSASGGACSLAFFDALLYDGRTAGASLRQAKNFLLAYALLKEKRLGKEATRTGANRRAAWAFTLWGDPTLRLPRPAPPSSARRAVRHEVLSGTIVLEVPARTHDPVRSARYRATLPPNARMAGLIRKERGGDARPLVPLVFAEVHLPRARPGQTPHLRTRLPASRWVFCWDDRRRCGYLLAAPRPGDGPRLRFKVEWPGAEVAARKTKD